ncbi:MAG: ABC transporter ATP-binding protein [bacterium]|nr:ABC transporter ATP-binding protein [bacterium]MCY3953503.1 ABC transporter ATP-binding protein [bacterium]
MTSAAAASTIATEPAGAHALTCRGVRVTFGETEALRGVDLHLAAGEWLGLIGPNGAGKSTLLRAIAGLVTHDGTVALDCGRRPEGTDVALVPQIPILPEGMSVAEYALLGRSPHLGWLAVESRRDRRIVTSVLERLNLQQFAARPVTHLSGGETQRVVLARALTQQAPILLLDEPTSALDLGHRDAVLELIDDLRCNDGISVVAAMHDLGTAARFADRLALIDRGRIVADGPPQSVLVPDRLSDVYTTPLSVHTVAGEIVVLPAPRTRQEHLP